jgi:uncharacterized protein (TIGR03546 family)
MFLSIVRLLRGLVQAFLEEDAPRRLAFGFALGMLIGLVPKGNLTAAALGVIVLASRANLGTAALATGLFSWVGMWLDPLTHRLGTALLTREAWQVQCARLYELPLVPWTRLNNTVVLGSLLLGIGLFLPVYGLSRWAFERYRESILKRIEEHKAIHVLAKAEAAVSWRVR